MFGLIKIINRNNILKIKYVNEDIILIISSDKLANNVFLSCSYSGSCSDFYFNILSRATKKVFFNTNIKMLQTLEYYIKTLNDISWKNEDR